MRWLVISHGSARNSKSPADFWRKRMESESKQGQQLRGQIYQILTWYMTYLWLLLLRTPNIAQTWQASASGSNAAGSKDYQATMLEPFLPWSLRSNSPQQSLDHQHYSQWLKYVGRLLQDQIGQRVANFRYLLKHSSNIPGLSPQTNLIMKKYMVGLHLRWLMDNWGA